MKSMRVMHRAAVAALAALALSGPSSPVLAASGDFPVLKPGLWEYQRTVAAKSAQAKAPTQTVRQCTSPSEDIKKKWAQLASADCKFSPIAHEDNRYTYTSVCRRNELALQMRSVITVHSDTDYRINTEWYGPGGGSKEAVTAHRIGDCASSPNNVTEGQASVDAPKSHGAPDTR
jgi:hypothetical protein